MSTSILYHGFGVYGYKYVKTEYREGALIFHIEKAFDKQSCADCGSKAVIKKGKILREMRTLPIGGKRVYLAVHLHRLLCRECGSLKLEPLLLSFPKKHWTKALGRYVVDMLRSMTLESLARHLGMSWDTIKEIHVWALKIKFKKKRIRHLKYLGVDEVAVRKGHSYLTVVVDLESGEVVWVCEGRESGALEPFLKRLKRAGAKIMAIAMDMWPAYLKAVLGYFSSKVIVFDRYHVVSDFNKVLDNLRRVEARMAPEAFKGAFMGVRYLLLKGEEKIEDGSKAREKLDHLLEINKPLNTAYVLKEELRHLWECPDRAEANKLLDNWVVKAWSSGIGLVVKFANKIAAHKSGILNYFNHLITTAKVEGINNKIKTLKRQAYGFRDMEYFKLRLYFLHESRYALVG